MGLLFHTNKGSQMRSLTVGLAILATLLISCCEAPHPLYVGALAPLPPETIPPSAEEDAGVDLLEDGGDAGYSDDAASDDADIGDALVAD